ncbi:kinase-like domain-containing protein [Abortiporus biennis]|nr:kinase-like domain-containing protein [Abortiporus biennis]
MVPDFTGRIIDNGRYQLVDVLGEGAYGVVYRAVDLKPLGSSSSTPSQYAVKILFKAAPGTREGQAQAREIITHKIASDHPNVLTLHDVLEDDWFIYLVLDYCPGGDLFTAVVERLTYARNDYLVKKVFIQILDAVDSCHRKGIFHRDLKPDNIFVNEDASEVFIGDFGLATDEVTSRNFCCGSSFYMSPECIGEEFNFKHFNTQMSDIWSLGVILVNLIAGRNPWRYATTNDEHFLSFMTDPQYLLHLLPISRAANDILRSIFAFSPPARISIPELREAIIAIDTFFLTDEEIAESNNIIQEAAALYRPTPTIPSDERDVGGILRELKEAEQSGLAYPDHHFEAPMVSLESPLSVDVYAIRSKLSDASSSTAYSSTSSSFASSGTESLGPITPNDNPDGPSGVQLMEVPFGFEDNGVAVASTSGGQGGKQKAPIHNLFEKLEKLAVQ